MFVTGFPGITIPDLFRAKQLSNVLPFPLNVGQAQNTSIPFPLYPKPYFYYFARNGIYHGLKAFEIKSGDEVLMPELNSTIEPQVVRSLGATPIFYKIKTFSPLTSNLSPLEDFTPDWDDVRSKLSNKTKFFHLIHYLGVPNDIEGALEFCETHKLIFFEDAAYGFLSGFRAQGLGHSQRNKNSIPSTDKSPAGELSPIPSPLGSFGHFSVLCPRKTVPIPNGGILVINGKPEIPIDPMTPTSPIRASYSSLWDWQYLLRNHPSTPPRFTNSTESLETHPHQTFTPKRFSLEALRKLTGYVFHGSSEFDPSRANWAMTQLAQKQLSKFDYPTMIKKNLENYAYVRDYCAQKGWDIFPREIKPGTVPNAILLKVPPGIENLTFKIENYTKDEAKKIENSANSISQFALSRGIQLARPWVWNENLTTSRNLPSVDAYTGRGLILPIHYELTQSHLDYYLTILSGLLK